jgi:DNA polymerase V
MSDQRTYIAIDLKSFYASVECVERGLDPLTTHLVVADASRTAKTICLAVSPSLKAYGISGRARLFEVVQRVREVNAQRRREAPEGRIVGRSTSAPMLQARPDLEVDYVVAPPRMAHYIDYSARIYNVYLQYVAPEDIHVYSIDEVFMDVTGYLWTYDMDPHAMAMRMIRDVLRQTGITATAGIGTNMYLCKIAMDIVAKHMPADKDGVRIAQLDEMSYRRLLWNHRPLTDFWRVGRGIARRLEQIGITTMGQIARQSVKNDEVLYRLFGVNAELLIDHAWGWEPCTMEQVKAYRPETNSLSSGQVLTQPYTAKMARVVVQEMAEAVALDLVEKHLVTNQMVLSVGYDVESLTRPEISAQYAGEVVLDHYGRAVPKPAHGSTRPAGGHTSSTEVIREAVVALFDRIVNPTLLVRRITIAVNNVIAEDKIRPQTEEPNLFSDFDALDRQKVAEKEQAAKERKIQETMLNIKRRYGKNAILKGLNFDEGSTARERNGQIGGHKA